ncbi:MAG: T9SS C-terminal target domain-containing protein [Chitinophagia bacterium]|nr:T9SS C-terminal target domain-containing protein [Chitinophagia bacterium]
MRKIYLLFLLVCLQTVAVYAQCLSFVHYPADTSAWVHGASQPSHPGHYNNDTFVICNARGGENNYLYSATPTTLYGTASNFSMSFDFRMDSSSSCSDGLAFWFLTSDLGQMGSRSHEGGDIGFSDTVDGFALVFVTTICWDDIYMKKLNTTRGVSWRTSSSAGDTNICTPLNSQMFLTDSQWHHCVVSYVGGNITTIFDGGRVTMTGYCPLTGTGRFGFMATNGGGHSRKCLKNISTCGSWGTPTASSDSLNSYVYRRCNGINLSVTTAHYAPSQLIKVTYGDGGYDTATTRPDGSGIGYVSFAHTYLTPGFFNIKQTLIDASTGSHVDSLLLPHENTFCSTLPIKLYVDGNANCTKDSNESYSTRPCLVKVDSAGIAIDTLSTTSGFYYTAYGAPGTVYAFKVISDPGNMHVYCPSSGIIYDTLRAGVFTAPSKTFGLNCTTGGAAFDLQVNAVIPVTGRNDQWGNIYVQNTYCYPQNATLTLHYSRKYAGTPTQVRPSAAAVTVGEITWNLASLSSSMTTPTQLHWEGEHGSTPLTIGDTVHTSMILTPFGGDVDTTNNIQIDVDTVRAGCDPNAIYVKPNTCIESGTLPQKLQYTITFENTGNDTAHNIYVMDTLSDYLNPSTMRLIMNSHEMFASKMKDSAGHTIFKFDFPKINLLDTSHHGECDGAFIYTIETRPGLAIGSDIMNRVGIYFDVNEVVMTNEAHNRIGCPVVGINTIAQNSDVQVFPNPAGSEITIVCSEGSYTTCALYNHIGQTVAQPALAGTRTLISLQHLSQGVYYLTLSGSAGRKVVRVVKW